MDGKETVITKAKSRENYEKIMFCMKAMGGAGSPLFTRYMHIENARTGSRIVCTDGKRLHAALVSIRIPAGNYRPEAKDGRVTFGKSADISFPAWKNVVPDKADFKGTLELSGLGKGTRAEREEKFSILYCSLLSETGFNVNMGFIKDLPSARWNVFTKKGRNSIVMLKNSEEQNQYAVFVPLAA